MKLKKLFAGVVAAAMIATMSFPAFATVSFSENPVTKIELAKKYNVATGTTAPAENLGFKMTFWKSEDVATAGAANAISLESTYYADFTNGGTVSSLTKTNTKNIEIDLTQLGINKVGKYYFKIQEVAGNKAGVTYDGHTRVLLVSAVNDVDADKKLNSTDIKFYAALYELGEDGETLGSKIEGSDAFENSYGTSTSKITKITLSKEVRGEFADREREFTFNIVLKPATGKTKDDYVGATVVKNGEAETWAIDESVTHTVTLKHGGTFVINNLPEGVTYTITEDFNDSNWTTKVGSTETKVASGTVNEDAVVEYVNKHNGVPDTGVILDNAPYMLMLAVVAGAAMTLVIKKRREEE